MIIKTALTGDNHHNTPGRVEEAHRVHEWMLADWRQRGVHFIGFAGDWNEVPPTEEDQAWSRGFFGRCAEVAPVVIIDGNHDPQGSLAEFHLQHEHKYPITVVSRPDVVTVLTAAGPLAVACVPFVWKAHLLAQLGSLSIEESDRRAQEMLTDIFRGQGLTVRKLGLPTVGLVHGKWRGSKLNEEQPNRPLGMEIPAEDIGLLCADFNCVGHIHLAQETTWNNRPIVTPSSCFFVDFGEARHFKGYVQAEFDSSVLHTKWERVPTPVMPMLLVEWDYDPTSPVSFRSRKETNGKIDFSGADVRLRFHYPKEAEAIAKRAAEANAERIREAGAVNVKLDPVPDPAIRSRIPELSEAATLEAKAQLYRDSMDVEVKEDEQTALDRCLQEIQDELANEGVSFGIQSRAVPSLKRIRGKGWLCFPDEFEIDLEKMQGPLTAVVAPNESGKTLLLNLMGPGLMYGDTVDRGSLDDISRARDSYIEGTFEMNGADHVLSQICNGETRKGMVTLSKDSKPLLQKAGRAEYATWAKSNLLPWNQYLALLFHSGTEDDGGKKINIIDMKDTARTELMLRVLGIEYYELIAKRAGDKASAVSSKLGETKARLDELKIGQTIGFCEEQIARLTDERRTADEALRSGELTLEDLRTKNAAVEKQRTEYGALIARRRDLELNEQRLTARIAELDQLITNCQTVLAEKAAIESAAEEVKRLSVVLADLKTEESDIRVKQLEARSTAQEKRQELQRLNDKLAGLNRSIANAKAIEKDKILAAVEDEKTGKTILSDLELAQEAAWREVEKIQGEATVSLEGRLGSSLDAHHIIAAGNADAPIEVSQGALDADRTAETNAREHPAKLAESKAAWQAAKDSVARQRVELAAVSRLAARVSEIQDAERIIEEAEQEIRELRSLGEELPVAIQTAESLLAEIETTWASKIGIVATAQGEIDRLTPLASKASRIAEAEAKIGLRREERETVAIQREATLESLSKVITDAVVPPPLIPLSEHETALAEARRMSQIAQTGLALAERQLDEAKGRETRRAALAGDADALTHQLDRWNRMAREWGPDGLPKEEVANAGPRLTELTNELLRAGGDTRHTVDIRTERPHSREKRNIPCFDILVRDSEEGQDKESRRLSGAGKLIVGKPLIMAMNILACERAGIKSCTISEDELTGPCSPENAIKIVGMLRYFAGRLNARILYVSQDPEIQNLADSAIKILPGGQIAVT